MAQQPSYSPPTVARGSRIIIVVSAGQPPTPPRGFVVVPDVLGEKQGVALASLQQFGMSSQVFNDYSDWAGRGDVVGQLPAAGASVPSGTEAVLLVSSGKAPSPTNPALLPDAVGKTEAEAVSLLQSAGFSPQIVREYSATAPAGVVTAQLPNRQSIAAAQAAKKPNWLLWGAIAAALVVVAILALFMLSPQGQVIVPDVVGLTQAEAVATLDEAGLIPEATEVEQTGDAVVGSVVTQRPAAGASVAEGSVVAIQVVQGADLVEVPDVRKENQADATKILQDAGLGVSVSRQSSTSVDKGLVIDQSPDAGQDVPAGTTVGIVVSEGPDVENVSVPNVVGMTQADAQSTLGAAGLKVVAAESSSDDVAEGVVITQLPEAGESVAPGTSIGIVVSSGPADASGEVDVPGVVGLTLADAQQVISDAGLEAIPVPSTGSGQPANEVVAQTPEPGTKAEPGGSVVLFYSTGP